MTVRLTGLGLVFFAFTLIGELIWEQRLTAFLIIPALCWVGAVFYLVPEDQPWRTTAIRGWALTALPVFILSIVNLWFSLIVVLALIGCVWLVASLARRSRFKNTLAVISVTGLFFAISTGSLLLPLDWLPHAWAILLLGLDLFLLGILITVWDAFEEGETIRSHLARSFVSALYYAGALAGLVLLAVAMDGEMTQGKLVALVGVVAFGVLTQAFSNSIQTVLDRFTVPRESALNEQRELLRAAAEGLPRLSTLALAEMEDSELAHLTRRAISNLGDLPKLASSPLIGLPTVMAHDSTNPLDRAHVLKTLLIENIRRLKPQGEAEFGTSDEWRYYNALYFPYVRGLKPYTRRLNHDQLDSVARQAMEWFQVSVPERTLHNWQNTAARLVAQSIKETELR